MATGRHSYVRLYPSDWIAGTARLNRILRSLYFDVCLYNWDYGEPLPKSAHAMMFDDVPDWSAHIQALIDMGKLKRTKGGGLYSERALNEARSSYERKVIAIASGKEGAAKRWKTKDKTDSHPNVVPIANHNLNLNLKESKKETEDKSSAKKDVFVLPDWVPAEAWDGWMDMRRRKAIPNTVRAMRLAVGELDKHRGQGQDPGKLLDLATMNGWRGIYPDRNGATKSSEKSGPWQRVTKGDEWKPAPKEGPQLPLATVPY
jgi:hypothetical protein